MSEGQSIIDPRPTSINLYRYEVFPKDRQLVDDLVMRMVVSVCGEGGEVNGVSRRVYEAAREVVLHGESICVFMYYMGACMFPPDAYEMIDGKLHVKMGSDRVILDGTHPGKHYLMWHITLNPKDGRGVPFDLDNGDAEDAIRQFKAQAGILLNQDPKQFTCPGPSAEA